MTTYSFVLLENSMGTSESLGYITRDNIIEVLEKVQRLAGFRFNAENF